MGKVSDLFNRTASIAVDTVNYLRGVESLNGPKLRVQARENGGWIREDTYSLDLDLEGPGSALRLTAIRQTHLEVYSAAFQAVSDYRLTPCQERTVRVEHVVRGEDLINSPNETFSDHPNTAEPLITRFLLLKYPAQPFVRRSHLIYYPSEFPKLDITIDIPVPSKEVKVNLVLRGMLCEQLSWQRYHARGLFNRGLETEQIKPGRIYDIRVKTAQRRTQLRLSMLLKRLPPGATGPRAGAIGPGPVRPDPDSTEPLPPVAVGVTIGNYQLIRRVHISKMSQVFLANQMSLDRKVAIKFSLEPTPHQSDLRARFEHEARVLAKMKHPNVVIVHEFGEFQRYPYLVMEYIDGEPLSSHKDRKHSLVEIQTLARQICAGLTEIHRAGLIHRDLKPANIMIDRNGNLRIIDFGLVKTPSPGILTPEGSILGTPDYMSPEQARGHSLDYRSDLFSLGIILAELATGRNPFHRDTREATLHAIMLGDAAAAIDFKGCGLPEMLQQIVVRLLAKDPGGRYQGAEEVAGDLARL